VAPGIIKSIAVFLVIGVGGCTRPKEQIYLDDDPLARDRVLLLREEAGIRMVFALQNECPNWEPALAIAKRKAGCGGSGADDRKAMECRKHFACDICQFLENAAWPPAEIKVLLGEEFLYLGLSHAEGATKIVRPRISRAQAAPHEHGGGGHAGDAGVPRELLERSRKFGALFGVEGPPGTRGWARGWGRRRGHGGAEGAWWRPDVGLRADGAVLGGEPGQRRDARGAPVASGVELKLWRVLGAGQG